MHLVDSVAARLRHCTASIEYTRLKDLTGALPLTINPSMET